jgi:hypothetical protein
VYSKEYTFKIFFMQGIVRNFVARVCGRIYSNGLFASEGKRNHAEVTGLPLSLGVRNGHLPNMNSDVTTGCLLAQQLSEIFICSLSNSVVSTSRQKMDCRI